jgi:hypothetical protein
VNARRSFQGSAGILRSLRTELVLLAVLCLVFTAVQALVLAPGAKAAVPVGFGKSILSGASKTRASSIQFGPDGRLYVLHQDGTINIYGVVRNGPNNYAVTSTQTVLLVRNIANHNDDGTVNNNVVAMACSSPCRQATGMIVTGTATQPVLYVSSSDPRYGGGVRGDLNLDTNSGLVSRLTWNAATSTWSKVDLVRGLPRSEENHATNGLLLDAATNTLYLAVGGNTNEGAPSNVFAYRAEYALAAAILSIDLDAIGNTTYDLPTLDDASRANNPDGTDVRDPFGGNNGLNQARIVPGGPVQVYASGFRNPYDLLFGTVGGHAGKMYATDNGYNAGQGGPPAGAGTANCTNANNDTSPVTGYDSLHNVTGPGYYAGHPNPTRGNNANLFGGQTPVPNAAENPIECTFRASQTATTAGQRGALGYDPSSTNGIVEYTASNFGGAMRGDLITAEWDGYVNRWQLNADGTALTAKSRLFSDVSVHPLDLTATGDSGPFPGTIWLADHPSGNIFVFEPNDFGGGGGGTTCTGADSATLDEDSDGYTNADEIDNGTDPCSAADQPRDWDNDLVSNLNDPDDDNDGMPDTSDPWAIDSANGTTTTLPINHPFDDTSDPAGRLLNLGFTGLMTNGTANYESLYDPTKLTAGGAGGVLTVDQVGPGNARGAANNQQYAFQYGFQLSSAGSSVFTPHTRVLAPFASSSPAGTESVGMQLGTGDQSNFLELAVSAANGGSIALTQETADAVALTRSATVSLSGVTSVDLFLAVNPVNRQVQPSYQLNSGATLGPRTNLGAAVTLPSGWFTQAALATGVIASTGGGSTFPATWDMFEIQSSQPSQSRPDARVRVSGAAAYTGNNVYNTTGTNQTVNATNARGTTRTFQVNVQNDGSVTGSYSLRGPGNSTGFTVQYLNGTTNITTAVVNGTYRLTNIAPAGSRTITMRVTVGSGAAIGSSKNSLVTATSTGTGAAADAVRTVVTVR